MTKTTIFLNVLLCALFCSQINAQTLNEPANWPNTNWTITGTYNTDPTAFEADPTLTVNFAFDDDDAGSGSDDNISAESPVIDLTAAHAAGETLLNLTADYFYYYLANDQFQLQYWDVDTSTWTYWSDISATGTTPTDDFCTGTKIALIIDKLRIDEFTATQLSGFKYRLAYDDDPAGADYNYGFCFDSPTIVSEAPPACFDTDNLVANNFLQPDSADLSWDAVVGATGYNWEIQPQGTAQGTAGAIASGSVATNNVTATGLVDETDYTIYVQTDCDSGNVGNYISLDISYIIPPANNTMAGATPIIPSPTGTGCDTNTFIAHAAGDGTTDSGLDGSCNGNDTGLDVFFTWTATSDALIWNDGASNPGIVIRDSVGTEITCSGTFAAVDLELSGWAIGDDLIIQVYDYGTADVNVSFCLEESMLPFCPDLENLTAGNFTAPDSAEFNWDAITNAAAYNWEIQPQGTAQGTTGEIASGTEIANNATATGLEEGIEYTFYVSPDCTSEQGNYISIDFTFGLPPANDDCTNAEALTVNTDLACGTIASGTTAFASASPEDTAACFGTENDDVWFTFVATDTRHQVELSNATAVVGTSTDLYHSVWEGTCGTLTQIGICSDGNTSTQDGLTIGNTYYVRVNSYSSTPRGISFDICIGTFPAPPANDDCANATEVACDDNLVSETTDSSTDNGDDTGCAMGAGVWYKYIGNDNTVTVTMTPETGFDPEMSVSSSADCTTFTNIDCEDSAGSGAAETITFDADAGTEYFIYVGHFNSPTTTGNFDLAIACVPYPACPDVENLVADNFTAPGNADLSWDIVTSATTYNWEIQPQGTPQGDAALIESGNVATNMASTTALIDGTNYTLYVQSDCEGGDLGNYVSLDFTFGLPPSNDDCANAEALTVNADLACGTVASGTTAYATASPEDTAACFGTENDDVWFTFVATDTRHQVTLDNTTAVVGTSTDLYHSVWEGTCGTLTQIGTCSDGDTSTQDGLTIGNTYYVRVNSYSSTPRGISFDICIGTFPAPPANNDFANAETLTVNDTCMNVLGTVVSATASGQTPFASCGSIDGTEGDIWYSFVAPANGNIEILTAEGTSGSILDTVMTLYSFDGTDLTIIECNDDGDDNEGNDLPGGLSSILITDGSLVGGDLYYIKINEYDGNNEDNFNICVKSSATANVNSLESVGFTYYPNPMKDELKMSANKNIETVTIFNMLGQEVLHVEPSNMETKVNVAKLANGTYFVKAKVGDTIGTFKVIKN